MVTPSPETARRKKRPLSPHRVGALIAGKYRVKRLLGQGGMGAVYKAENTTIGRTVALKVLHSHLADDGVTLTRFQREARAAAGIDHPHVVDVLDMGVVDETGAPFIVMEYVRGKSCAQLLRAEGPAPPIRAADILGQTLAALHAVHGFGIVHRDLKPENVLLTVVAGRQDFVKVFDFGVAAFVESTWAPSAGELTPTGRTMGTPYYTSPEQLSGGRGRDARVDVYAAGVLLYELLTGNRPFVDANFADLCRSILKTTPPPMRAFVKNVPPALEAVAMRAMAKKADERFPSARAMHEALVPFGAMPVATDEPEPTDTFTVDLRELRLREQGAKIEDGTAAGRIRGEVVSAVLSYLRGELGTESVRAIASERRIQVVRTEPDRWYDEDVLELLEDADRRVADGVRELVARAGGVLAERCFDRGTLPSSATPELVFSMCGDLWVRFFADGEASVRELGRGYGVLEVDGHPAPSLPRSVLMVGFLDRALRMTGARAVEVRLGKAAALGDGRDVFEASWSS